MNVGFLAMVSAGPRLRTAVLVDRVRIRTNKD